MELHFVLFLDDSSPAGCDFIDTKVIIYAVFVEIDDNAKNIDFLDTWVNGNLKDVIPGFNLL